MSNRRIVITGMGAVTPLGLDVTTTWDNLIAGKSGVSPITSWDASKYDCRFAAQVSGFEPRKHFFNEKDARRADRYAQLAMASAKEAVKHGGLDPEKLDLDRVGVLVGSGIGGLTALGEQSEILLTKGPGRVSPFLIPMMISNMAAGLISMEFGFAGPNFAVVTACATSNNRRSLASDPRRRSGCHSRRRQRSGLRSAGNRRIRRHARPQHAQRRT